MAKIPNYQIGAIYAVQTPKNTYYFRLLQGGRCAFFAPFSGKICEEIFEKIPYLCYISCNSHAIKKEIWKKIFVPNGDKNFQVSLPILANFSNFTLVHHFENEDFRVWKSDGELYPIEKEAFIKMVKSGQILHIFNNHEAVANFLDSYYEDYPNSYLFDPQSLSIGNEAYQKQIQQIVKLLKSE